MTNHLLQNNKTNKDFWLLYGGVKSLLRCDNAEVVQGIARYVISQYRSLQVSTEYIESKKGTAIPDFIAFLSGVTRFLEVCFDGSNEKIIWIARYDNELHAIEKLRKLIPDLSWIKIDFRRPSTFKAISALIRRLLPNWRHLFRIARLLHRQHKYFKVFRVIELISYYSRYSGIFEKGDFRLAIVSNHSNPHGIAFNLAARRCGVPVVLVTHGMPIKPVAKLNYELAIVHCEIARQIYLDAGCKLDKIIIHGRKQDYASMPALHLPHLVKVGIFLCKDVNEGRLKAITNKLLAHPRISHVLIRPHPKNLWLELESWVKSPKNPRLQISSNKSVFGDLKNLDVVFAGNSSVLVEAVTAGRPAVYLPNIDHGLPDHHQFVSHGLIFQMDEAENFEPDEVLNFYLRPEWLELLHRFANIDEDEMAVEVKIKSALVELSKRSFVSGKP